MTLWLAVMVTGIGSYLMRASFILLLAGVQFPPRMIRILDHVGPAVMAALVVTTMTSSEGVVSATLPELAALATMVVVTVWRRHMFIGLLAAMLVYLALGAL